MIFSQRLLIHSYIHYITLHLNALYVFRAWNSLIALKKPVMCEVPQRAEEVPTRPQLPFKTILAVKMSEFLHW